jgi:hypothetical protein
MPTQAPTLTIKVPVRLLFTNALIAPAPFRGKGGAAGAPRYNVQCLIEAAHPQLGEIQQLVMAVANEAFPGRQWPTTANNGLPLKNGATLNAERVAAGRQPYDCYNGHFVLFTQKPEKSQAGTILDPPILKVLMNGEYVEFADAQRPLAKEYFYNGVRAVGEFQLKAFAGFGGGVTCYLNRIYSLNVGEKIAVGKDDEERFGSIAEMAQYQGSVSTVNPLAPVGGQPW